jgi:hypothetical protein
MTELSKEAQAVLDALYMEELNGPQQLMARAHAVAVLRAAADQVVPEQSEPPCGEDEPWPQSYQLIPNGSNGRKLAPNSSPSPTSWRANDSASDVRASRRLRRGVLLGAVAGVQDSAVIGVWRWRRLSRLHASPQPPHCGMPSDGIVGPEA